MSDTSSTIKRSVGLVKTCSSYKDKTLVHNTILPRPIVIMLKSKSNQSFETFSLIRCFSDILIRMSEYYKTVRNPTDDVTKFWQFHLKQFRNMIRMSEFLTVWSYSQTVRKGPDQANYVKTLTYPYNGIKLWHRDLFCSFHSGDNLLLVLKKLPITNCLLIT